MLNSMAKKKPTGRQRVKSLGLRLDPVVVMAVRKLAARNRRTLTAEIEIALERHAQEAGLWPPAGDA